MLSKGMGTLFQGSSNWARHHYLDMLYGQEPGAVPCTATLHKPGDVLPLDVPQMIIDLQLVQQLPSPCG